MRPDWTDGRTSPAVKVNVLSRSGNDSTLLPDVVVALSGSHLSPGPLNPSITIRFAGEIVGAEPSGTPVGCGEKPWSGPSSGRRTPGVTPYTRYTNAALWTRSVSRRILPPKSDTMYSCM